MRECLGRHILTCHEFLDKNLHLYMTHSLIAPTKWVTPTFFAMFCAMAKKESEAPALKGAASR
jgi:hypothetical protein